MSKASIVFSRLGNQLRFSGTSGNLAYYFFAPGAANGGIFHGPKSKFNWRK